MEQLNKLLADIRDISYRTYGATIFDMLGNGGKETIHSAMIGFLINPIAHEAGAYCLQEFMKRLPTGINNAFNHKSIKQVVLEYDFGPVVIDKHPKGGRADIYVEDSHGYALVIENKIYAGDQKCQLLRYHNSLEDRKQPHALVYLTLFGKKPSNYSLGSETPEVTTPLSANAVILLSYGTINEWLSTIKHKCKYSIKYNIEQYQVLIDKLIMEETIINNLLSSGDNYFSAIKIAEHIEDCRIKLKRMFMQDLQEALAGYVTDEIEDGKIVGLRIDLESNVSIDVLIDWRLYISCNEPNLLGFHLENETWEYVGAYDEYNFHDGSSQVKRYLSTRENGNPVIADVANHLKSRFPLKHQ